MSGIKIGKIFKKLLPVIAVVAVAAAAVFTFGAAAAALPAVAGAAGAAGGAAGAAGVAAGTGFAVGGTAAASLGTVAGGAAAAGAGATLGFAGTAAAGATAATLGGAVAGGVAGAASSGVGGVLGSLFSSEIAGKVISGAALGLVQSFQAEDEEAALVRQEERYLARYEGAGAAAGFGPRSPASERNRRLGLPADGAEPGAENVVKTALPSEQTTDIAATGQQTPEQVAERQAQLRTSPERSPVPRAAEPEQQVAQMTPRRPSLVGQPAAPRQPRYRYNPETGRIDYA